jgi:predicted enzyme related to lactoylglutathione lyase
MPNTFDWIELNAKNLDKLSAFYRNIFGWEIITRENIQGYEFRIFNTRGKPRVENISRFGIWQNPTKSTNGPLVYIWVENINKVLEKIEENGGKVIEVKNFIGPGYRAIFSDPEGNNLALFEDK